MTSGDQAVLFFTTVPEQFQSEVPGVCCGETTSLFASLAFESKIGRFLLESSEVDFEV